MSLIAQLKRRNEITENTDTIEHQIRYQQQLIASARRALAFLQSDGHCKDNCAALIIDFFHASQIWGTPIVRVKYATEIQEMIDAE